jgi:DNA-binding MarR family transcriptional regulator
MDETATDPGEAALQAAMAGFDLRASPAHLLHRAQQAAADLHAAEFGATGPTRRQLTVLVAVAGKDGATQTDLVEATGIDRSTLADMIARMTAKSLLTRARSAKDGRANAVSLTPAGRDILIAALPRLARVDAGVLAGLPGDRRKGFTETLAALALPGANESVASETPKKKKRKSKDKKKAKARKLAKAEAEAA